MFHKDNSVKGSCSSGLSGLRCAFPGYGGGCDVHIHVLRPVSLQRRIRPTLPPPVGEAAVPGQRRSWELCPVTAISLLSHYEFLTHKCCSAISELYSCSGSYHLLRQVIRYICCWLYEIVLTILTACL